MLMVYNAVVHATGIESSLKRDVENTLKGYSEYNARRYEWVATSSDSILHTIQLVADFQCHSAISFALLGTSIFDNGAHLLGAVCATGMGFLTRQTAWKLAGFEPEKYAALNCLAKKNGNPLDHIQTIDSIYGLSSRQYKEHWNRQRIILTSQQINEFQSDGMTESLIASGLETSEQVADVIKQQQEQLKLWEAGKDQSFDWKPSQDSPKNSFEELDRDMTRRIYKLRDEALEKSTFQKWKKSAIILSAFASATIFLLAPGILLTVAVEVTLIATIHFGKRLAVKDSSNKHAYTLDGYLKWRQPLESGAGGMRVMNALPTLEVMDTFNAKVLVACHYVHQLFYREEFDLQTQLDAKKAIDALNYKWEQADSNLKHIREICCRARTCTASNFADQREAVFDSGK